MRDLARDVAAGKPVKLSHDQAVRAIAETTRRKSDESRQLLLGALSGGISQVFEKALSDGDGIAGELEAAEDAEFEDVGGDD